MSVLTKVFVVLLVVCSMLLTAAMIVFVNQVQDFATANERLQNDLRDAQHRANMAEAAQQAAVQSEAAAVARLNARDLELNQRNTELQQHISDRDIELEGLRSRMAIQEVNVTNLAEGLRASELTRGQLQGQLVETTRAHNELIGQAADLNRHVSDLTSRLEVTEERRKHLQEQLVEAQAALERTTALLHEAGIDVEAPDRRPRRAIPPIVGVVRNVQRIEQIPYATINVGSADNVQPGMEFHVIDGEQWLGRLVVDRVEPNEAIGQLVGPRIDNVRPGAQVRTQL